MAFKDLGYKYVCDVCDREFLGHSRPQFWTFGEFKTEEGFSFGKIAICERCHTEEIKLPVEKTGIFKTLWHKLGWGRALDKSEKGE